MRVPCYVICEEFSGHEKVFDFPTLANQTDSAFAIFLIVHSKSILNFPIIELNRARIIFLHQQI